MLRETMLDSIITDMRRAVSRLERQTVTLSPALINPVVVVVTVISMFVARAF